MDTIKTLIVDDEYQARKGLRALLAAEPDIEIIGECGDGQQAIDEIGQSEPDLVFLDVQMPDKNGFEVLAALDPERAPALVFITAYDQYALKAFEFSALDYLLKPFTDERFRQAVTRARRQCRQRRTQHLSQQLLQLLEHHQGAAGHDRAAPVEPLQRFFIKTGGEVHFVPVDEVDWLEADGYCTRIHVGKKAHLLRGNLGGFEAQLDPRKFARINRSAIINLNRVQSLKTWFHDECLAVLPNGIELKVSAGRRRRLEHLLERLV
ncbi:MAG: LytR/AlgR family response regulator transcription factor [Blastocatellia bacterium]